MITLVSWLAIGAALAAVAGFVGLVNLAVGAFFDMCGVSSESSEDRREATISDDPG